jgi:alpha-glucosidase
LSASAIEPWWTDAVGYEVYIRSYQDSDGSGVGDLNGITARLGHLAWLGIDVVWLTPFYRSPMADFGYDVADYVDVDPLFGTLADFDALVARAHELGIRVVADIVPNHSSDQHRWFVESRSSRENPFRDHYIWRDPAPDGGPPNNWLSHFGGPAWTFDDATGQYYCHLFLPEQPDLNWRNPAVRDEMEQVLRFWLDRGIDGFRIDVAHALYKDEQLRDDPVLAPIDEVEDARGRFACLEHRYDLLQPESLDVFRRWREIVSGYDAVLIGETFVLSADQLAALVPGNGLHLGFWFGPMHMAWTPTEIGEALRAPTRVVSAGTGWVLSSHDASRPVARFGGGDKGRRRALGVTTLMFGLPGMPFLYQGEELGLDDADLSEDDLADPLAVRNQNTPGRDVCRTPMPWAPGPNLGFSTADRTWLPVGHGEADTVAMQRRDPASHLNRVRELLALRRTLTERHSHPVEWIEGPDIVGYRRGDLIFALHVGDGTRPWTAEFDLDILFRSVGEAPPEASTRRLDLEPDEAVIARRAR